MIKRIIGILATVAVLALVVFAAIGSGSYKTMVFGKKRATTEQVATSGHAPESVAADEVAE